MKLIKEACKKACQTHEWIVMLNIGIHDNPCISTHSLKALLHVRLHRSNSGSQVVAVRSNSTPPSVLFTFLTGPEQRSRSFP
ncbi:hypothetical protein DPMN_053088 [Dreissena polymorpha]|uniref:Uncharacterized protein n=1 Tax=Dreissena polymorpha TaxID=45954 RepID=A0A9D4CMC7_DREPO|nr:hypothetical protein DPMN_053088 [Dreissena polymorpha]